NFEADSGTRRRFDRALTTDGYRRLDNILFPVPRRGRNIAGQGETGQRRERNVVGPADSCFEHSSTPDGHPSLFCKRLNSFGFSKSADATEFDIDNAARAQLVRVPGISQADD